MSGITDTIFDFIFVDDAASAASRLSSSGCISFDVTPSLHLLKDEVNGPHSSFVTLPTQPVSPPTHDDLLEHPLVHSPPSHPSSPSSPLLSSQIPLDILKQEPQDDQEEETPNLDLPVLTLEIRKVLLRLISEYLNETMALKAFFQKVRTQLCMETDNTEVFAWIIRSMLECGHTNRMMTFLEENGVKKEEVEIAAIKRDKAGASDEEDEFGNIGEKRKRRERKRVSISRGLRSPPNKWSKAESQRLIRLVFEFGDKSWKKIAEQLGGGKTGAQCAQHWKRVLSPEIRKGSWDDQEETLLFTLVQKHGQSWKNIAAEIKTRTDIQCRYQYQKACLSRQCEWLPQEDVLLKKKVALCGQERKSVSWTDVSKFIARAKLTKIPRTALECKERWGLLNGMSVVNSNINSNSAMIYSNSNVITYGSIENKSVNASNAQPTSNGNPNPTSPILVC